jgi:hypothetical protein
MKSQGAEVILVAGSKYSDALKEAEFVAGSLANAYAYFFTLKEINVAMLTQLQGIGSHI